MEREILMKKLANPMTSQRVHSSKKKVLDTESSYGWEKGSGEARKFLNLGTKKKIH